MLFFRSAYIIAVFFSLSCLAAEVCDSSSQDSSSRMWCKPAQNQQYPIGDLRNCLNSMNLLQNGNKSLYRLDVVPGGGFDNLRNLDMGQVHFYNYSMCQLSNDGQYLLPDSVFLIPIQESKVETTAEFFEHWDDYTSTTSMSINLHAGVGLGPISAKFSAGYSTTKTHQVSSKSKIVSTRIQVRQRYCTVKLQPDAQLHPTFKSRLFDLAAHLHSNNTEYMHYLAELIVRDYGTHYITSMDAGALIAQTDFFDYSNIQDSDSSRQQITASASKRFFGIFSFGSSFLHTTSLTNSNSKGTDYTSRHMHSEVTTVGGPPMNPSTTISDWAKGVPNALAALDRSGEPLHFVINPENIPELPEMTVRTLSDTVYKAINRYYTVNTRYGCTNPTNDNFNFHANVDNGACKPPSTNLTFGGVYQTCTVDPDHNTEDLCTSGPQPAQQNNPLTGGLSCPEPYTAIKIHSGQVTHVVNKPVCTYHRCGFLHLQHCKQCVQTPFLSRASYEAYWCAALQLPGATVPSNSGYLFGGTYTSKDTNPLTRSKSCPLHFIPLHIGEDTKVCVSQQYDLGKTYAFGGFESCIVGNPLAAAPTYQNTGSTEHWPHGCPHGYIHHLATIDEGCEINVCIHAGALRDISLLPAKLPPFHKYPKVKGNLTDTLAIVGVHGDIWTRDESGRWEIASGGPEMTGKDLLISQHGNTTIVKPVPPPSDNNSGTYSNIFVAVLSVLGTIFLGFLIVAIVFAGRHAYRKYRGKGMLRRRSTGYVAISESMNDLSPGQDSNSDPVA